MDDWNLTRKEGENLIIDVFKNILINRTNVNEHELCLRMSYETNLNKIYIFRNGKRRNLNNFMKVEFDGLHNFLKTHEKIFEFKNKIITLK